MSFWNNLKIWKSILIIKKDVRYKIKKVCNEDFWIDVYGAYTIDPNSLV